MARCDCVEAGSSLEGIASGTIISGGMHVGDNMSGGATSGGTVSGGMVSGGMVSCDNAQVAGCGRDVNVFFHATGVDLCDEGDKNSGGISACDGKRRDLFICDEAESDCDRVAGANVLSRDCGIDMGTSAYLWRGTSGIAAAAAAAVALVSEAARVVRCISRCAATCAARFSPRGSGASRGPRSGGGDTGTSRIEVDKGPRDREIHTQHGHTPMTYQAAGHAPRPAHGPLLVQRLLLVLFNGEAQVHGIANDLRCECMHVRGRRPRVGAKKACRLSRTDRAPRARPCSWSEWPGTRRGADPADRASQSRCLGQPRPRTPEPHQVIHLHLARKQVL